MKPETKFLWTIGKWHISCLKQKFGLVSKSRKTSTKLVDFFSNPYSFGIAINLFNRYMTFRIGNKFRYLSMTYHVNNISLFLLEAIKIY